MTDGFVEQCGCPLMGGHREFCASNPEYALNMLNATRRLEGFVWTGSAYRCERGCGCLVWDTETHKQNVCTTYEI